MKNKILTLATCLFLLNVIGFAQNSPKNAKVNPPKKAQKAPLNSQSNTKKSEKK
jgi:hypothetical protein